MSSEEKLPLPLARYEEIGCEGIYTVACSMITSENLIDFLDREEVEYIDIRNIDEAEEKRLKGFKVVPFLDVIYSAEASTQLYYGSVNEPMARYEESDEVLHELIPMNKPVFLLCRSGRRVTQLMLLLEAKGYDMSLIYNIGGVDHYISEVYDDLWVKGKISDTIDLSELNIIGH